MAQRLTRLLPTICATTGSQKHRHRHLDLLARHSFAGCLYGPSPVLLRSLEPAELGIRMRAASSTSDSNTNVTTSQISTPQVIVLTGATGVGKTELSLILAESLNGEIISADSVQVSGPQREQHSRLSPASIGAVPALSTIRWLRGGDHHSKPCMGTIHVTVASAVKVTPVDLNKPQLHSAVLPRPFESRACCCSTHS